MPRPIRPARRWPLSPRLRRAERLVITGFVLAMLVVSWGALALWQSMNSHRATADETLRDHASYISRNYSVMYGTESWYLFRNIFAAAQDASAAPLASSIADLIRDVASRSYDAEGSRVEPSRFFAGDSTGWRITASGPEMDSVLVARLNARLADSMPRKISYRGTVVVRPHGDTTLALVTPRRGGVGWVGFEVPLASYRDAVLAPAPARTQAFFETMYDSLPEKRPAGTLRPIAVRVVSGDGVPMLDFNPSISGGWTMEDPTLPAFSAHLVVTVGPQAVPYLMPGGYPAMPGPRVAGVIVLALLLLSGTAFLAWRTLSVSRMREEFTNAVSHELRTPLANIHLYAETLLLERVTDPAARRTALETITRETRRLGDLVENVLATARMARAEETLRPRPDRVGRIVHEVLGAFEPVLASRSIDVDVAVIGDDYATIDTDAIRRIMVNLLDNAIRHGPDGQRLRVSIDHTNDEVLLVVEDEGPGIRIEDRERVWMPFVRGTSGGSGLGLAVVRHLARLHGGDAVVGDRDHGARIEVRLAAQPEAG